MHEERFADGDLSVPRSMPTIGGARPSVPTAIERETERFGRNEFYGSGLRTKRAQYASAAAR